MSSSEQERLQEEIEKLRSGLGETVEALVHKVDVPARAKERASELKDEAKERASEIKHEAAERGGEVKDRAFEVIELAREQVRQAPTGRWAMLAAAGAALITLTVIIRRIRAR